MHPTTFVLSKLLPEVSELANYNIVEKATGQYVAAMCASCKAPR